MMTLVKPTPFTLILPLEEEETFHFFSPIEGDNKETESLKKDIDGPVLEGVSERLKKERGLPCLYTIISWAIDSPFFTIDLNPSEIQYIQGVLDKDPVLFHTIGDSIHEILKDGKLNVYDLPRIILLISDMFKSHCIERLIEDVGVLNLVKFTLDSILEFKYLPILAAERHAIRIYMDQSLALLAANVEFVKETEKNLYYYVCCLFLLE